MKVSHPKNHDKKFIAAMCASLLALCAGCNDKSEPKNIIEENALKNVPQEEDPIPFVQQQEEVDLEKETWDIHRTVGILPANPEDWK